MDISLLDIIITIAFLDKDFIMWKYGNLYICSLKNTLVWHSVEMDIWTKLDELSANPPCILYCFSHTSDFSPYTKQIYINKSISHGIHDLQLCAVYLCEKMQATRWDLETCGWEKSISHGNPCKMYIFACQSLLQYNLTNSYLSTNCSLI